MSFPIRSIHSPSPLNHRCFPSPPPSESGDERSPTSPNHRLRSPSESRKSMDFAYFPLVTDVSPHNDSYSIRVVHAPLYEISSARVALAWAILRLRHPILASVGLVDPFGKVSYSYDPPLSNDTALFEAETSLEFRRNTSDLAAFYESGSRRVSRSHLSHLIFATSPSSGIMSPPPTPPPIPDQLSRSSTQVELAFLLCTPHYVADSKALDSYLEELVALLTRHPTSTYSDLEETLTSELSLAAAKLPSPTTMKSVFPPPLKMMLPRQGRFQRSATV